MKKLCLLTALCLMLSIFAACGKEPAPTETTAPLLTLATEAPTTEAPTTVPPTEPPAPKVIDYSLEAPEGFEASVVQDAITVLSSPNAPRDTSTIVIEVLPMDESVLDRSAAEFEELITGEATPTEATEPSSDASQPSDGTEETTLPPAPKDYNLLAMEEVEIDGWPAQFCEYNLIYKDYASHIFRFEVVVNEANYVFTFTDNTDSNVWLDAFEASGQTIDFILDTEGISLNYSDLTLYNLDCGLSIYAEAGMEAHKAEGFTGCIGNRNVILLVMADDKQTNNLTDLDPAGYAEVLRQTNDLDEFRTDIYNNLYTSFYSTDENGMQYFNMIFIKETDEDFWVCQLACSAEDQASYAKAFPLWASSITGTN